MRLVSRVRNTSFPFRTLLAFCPPASRLASRPSPICPRRRQIARAKEIKSHFLQQQAHSGADARKLSDIATKGVVVSLGLIKPEGEEASGGGK